MIRVLKADFILYANCQRNTECSSAGMGSVQTGQED